MMISRLPDLVLKKNCQTVPELCPFEDLGILNFVSNISQKVFELVA